MVQIGVLLTFAWALAAAEAKSPPVRVSLRTSWPAPPLLVEIIETVALEHPDAFFPFLDHVTDPTTAIHGQPTAEAIRQYALQIAVSHGSLSESGSLASVEMNLALHAATPKLEAFYGHYADITKKRDLKVDCGSWVDWYGTVVCDLESLKHLAGIETIDPTEKNGSSTTYERPKLLTFDHIYPPTSQTLAAPPRTAIFYASLKSANFRELHSYLFSLAKRPVPHVEYVFRHIPETPTPSAKSYLSGYSVALDLKKMDYLAVDDRHSKSFERADDNTSNDNEETAVKADAIQSLIENYPNKPDQVSTPLNDVEIQGLGIQAVQLIADSSKPLEVLKQLSQNFPKYATSLGRRVVANASISDEIHGNQLRAQGGVSAFWINGANIQDKDINPFGLLRFLRKERGVIHSLTSLGLSRGQAVDVLAHPDIAAAQANRGGVDGLVDASDRIEGGDVIIWWNDFEKDSRYEHWSPSLKTLLRQMYPGQFPQIRHNLFNIILAIDLSQTESLNFIAGPVSSIIDQGFPFRFGVVPLVETQDGTKMARLFYYLLDRYGRANTMAFIKEISQYKVPPQLTTPKIQWDVVATKFSELLDNEDENVALEDVLSGKVKPRVAFERIEAYVARLGTSLAASSTGHAFVNGKHFEMGEECALLHRLDTFLRHLQGEVGAQTQYLQEQIYSGKLTDEESMTNYFYDLPSSTKRRNRHIIPGSGPGDLKIYNLPEVFSRTGFARSQAAFLYGGESESIPCTVYLVADFDTPHGQSLLKEGLKYLADQPQARLSFIHNPNTTSIDVPTTRSPISWLLSHLLANDLLSKTSTTNLLKLFEDDRVAPPSDGPQIPLTQKGAFEEASGGVSLSKIDGGKYGDLLKESRLLLRELHILPGQHTIIINGRVVGPLEEGDFGSADFKALESYELRRRIAPVISALESVQVNATSYDRATFAHLVSMASSLISAIQIPDPSETGLFDGGSHPRTRNYRLLNRTYTGFEFGDNTTAIYHVTALVDPLSETGQKWASILEWLSDVPDIYIEVYLNPARLGEMPLKRFFRYNLKSSLSFDSSGLEVPSVASFDDLPIDPIYTLAMDVPTSWLVRPREALYDLDNIQLGRLAPEDSSVDAVFELDYIVIEGHARDKSNVPPRGVQLQLLNANGTAIDDTQVVANLGYFQFKARPGVFQLEIREGRGREVFEMESVGNDGWESASVNEVGNGIAVTSFEGSTIYPRFTRKPGMAEVDVLADPVESDKSEGILGDVTNKIKAVFGLKPTQAPATNSLVSNSTQADINIFTVASGLLYERFVGIMILSVLRNTKSTVKFWFIENFLSPSFLEIIPHLAEAYGFQYELVTYKWPSWLRAQKEKQRIIWAYKILFLDVLFPMDLKKVIFVDADQIVRADLKELVDLDLGGAPYGYTPMGDDNTDMEGFRFWKTGYWKDFLRGKPYHISALYVVDLVRFRQIAAGDILRGQYQQLSADPHSLANLDQDLPNNIQDQVPIHSLHEDWLWCETWCSKDRLHRAKTIDLCQNPLTKEPKLARARQIPEWDEYDGEISRFTRGLAEKGLIHSRTATADTNVLANAGSGGAAASGTDGETSQEASSQPRDEL